MQNGYRTLAVVFTSTALASCATMMSGSTQKVQLVSDPPGAVAKVAGREVTTPATLELRRSSNYRVTFEKEGYESTHREIARKVNPQVWWNLLTGGLPGMLVDLSSGAFYELVPPVVQASLIPGDDHTAPSASMDENR